MTLAPHHHQLISLSTTNQQYIRTTKFVLVAEHNNVLASLKKKCLMAILNELQASAVSFSNDFETSSIIVKDSIT